jgi:hypothetical protein
MRTCALCGCTDERACEGGCSWVTEDRNDGGNCCSKCAESELVLLPTRTCFDDVNKNLTAYLLEHQGEYELLTNRKVLVVHGIINPYGTEIAHAWLEIEGRMVIDSAIFKGEYVTYHADLADYYKRCNVVETTKYTLKEAAIEERRHGHFAPWVAKYRAMNGRD